MFGVEEDDSGFDDLFEDDFFHFPSQPPPSTSSEDEETTTSTADKTTTVQSVKFGTPIPYSPNVVKSVNTTESTTHLSGMERIWMIPPFILGLCGVAIFLLMLILTIFAVICRMNRYRKLNARRKSMSEMRKPLYIDFNYPINAFSPQPNVQLPTKQNQIQPHLRQSERSRDLYNRSPIYATTEVMKCRRPDQEQDPLPPSNLGIPPDIQPSLRHPVYATATLDAARLRRPTSMYDGYMDHSFQVYGYGGHYIPKARMVSDPALLPRHPPPPVILRQNHDYIRLLREPACPPPQLPPPYLEGVHLSKESLRHSKDTLDSLPPPPPPMDAFGGSGPAYKDQGTGDDTYAAVIQQDYRRESQASVSGQLDGASVTSDQSEAYSEAVRRTSKNLGGLFEAQRRSVEARENQDLSSFGGSRRQSDYLPVFEEEGVECGNGRLKSDV